MARRHASTPAPRAAWVGPLLAPHREVRAGDPPEPGRAGVPEEWTRGLNPTLARRA